MKNASEDLVKEHEGILFGLEIFESMVNQAESGEKTDIEGISEMIGFIKLFADKCHHGKEENLFFPALEKAGVKKENGPIGQMLLEHDMGRKYIAQMTNSTENGVFDKEAFIQAAREYIELLRSHIDKENTILFPYGDRLLPAEEQTRLLKLFEDFEEQVMGKGTHERLHRLLDKYEAIYLPEAGQ